MFMSLCNIIIEQDKWAGVAVQQSGTVCGAGQDGGGHAACSRQEQDLYRATF